MDYQVYAYYHISIEISRVREINIENHTHCFFDDMIPVINLDPNNIKIDKIHIKISLFTKLVM